MFDADFPHAFCCFVSLHFEPNCLLVTVGFSRSNSDEEIVTFVRNLEYFGPRNSVDFDLIPEDQNAGPVDADVNVDVVRVQTGVQVSAIHGQLLGILDVVHFSIGSRQTLMVFPKSLNLLDQIHRVCAGAEGEVVEERGVHTFLEVSHVCLTYIRSQKRLCVLATRHFALAHVISELEIEQVAGVLQQLGGIWRVKLHIHGKRFIGCIDHLSGDWLREINPSSSQILVLHNIERKREVELLVNRWRQIEADLFEQIATLGLAVNLYLNRIAIE